MTVKTLKGREADVREKANEVLAKEEEIHQLQQRLDESQVCEDALPITVHSQK